MSCEEDILGPDEPENKDAPVVRWTYPGGEWSPIVQQFGWILGDRDPLTGEWRTP